MRKLIEIAVVFALGWLLAVVFVMDKNNPQQGQPQNSSAHHNPHGNSSAQSNPTPGNTATRQPAKTDPIRQHLEQGDIDRFVEALKSLRSADEQHRLGDYQKLFINSLQSLKQSKQYGKAIDWLSIYLQAEYDDVNALRALADFHYLQQNHLAAIDTLYLAKSYCYDNEQLQQVTNSIRKLTAEYTKQLEKQDDQLAMLDLYQRLVNVEPEYNQHHLRLAQTYAALGNYYDAKQALNVIAYSPETEMKVRQLLSSIENQANNAASSHISVSLTRQGNHLLANTLFNDNTTGRLLLDTGASLTVLTPRFMQELRMDHLAPQRMAWFNTANGVIEAPIYIVDSVSIGGQSVAQLEIAVMDLHNQHIDGLLGMNYLKHFRFSIDQEKNALLLSPHN